MKHKGCRSWGT